jgi:cytochrome P450
MMSPSMEGTCFPPVGRPEDVADFLHDPVGCMSALYRTYGPVVAFRKEESGVVFAFGPSFNYEILTNPEAFHIVSVYPGPRNSAQRRFRSGLFSMNGAEHQKHRRLLTLPFRKEETASSHESFGKLLDERLAKWQPGQVIDLAYEMKQLTLQWTTQFLFGLEELGAAHAVEQLFEEWLNLNHAVSFSMCLPCDVPADTYSRLMDVATRLEEALKALVHQKRAAGHDAKALVAILMRAQEEGVITETEVIGQTITLFNAAYHTTTYALTWNLFLLYQHPQIARALLTEMNQCLPDDAWAPGDLERVTLLERVIKEGLRLLPPVVYLPRVTSHSTTLGAYGIPAHTFVLPSPYLTHHMPQVFPDPERYWPDRWVRPKQQYAYLPFGGGQRLCLGAPLALTIVRLALAAILRRFRLSVVPGSRIDRMGTLTLEARFGVPVSVHYQDGRFAASNVVGNIHEMVQLPGAFPERIAA